MDYGKKSDKTMMKRRLQRYKSAFDTEVFHREISDMKYLKDKKDEISSLAIKYGVKESQANSILKYYLYNKNLSNGDIIKSVDFLNLILKSIFGYSDEEVSHFLNSNSWIMKSKYSDFRVRLSIFNHFGLLEDVIFKGAYYLTYDFILNNFDTKCLYALIIDNNISSLDELHDIVDKVISKNLTECVKKYPLTNEIIQELGGELQKKIRKESFKRELERRKSLKM